MLPILRERSPLMVDAHQCLEAHAKRSMALDYTFASAKIAA
jgi:hypothetical protein